MKLCPQAVTCTWNSMHNFRRKYHNLHLSSSTGVTEKNGGNYILMPLVLFSVIWDLTMIHRASGQVNGNKMYIEYWWGVSILESSNSDAKTWQENIIKLGLGQTVVKFMALKLPSGSMQALVRSFWPLDSSSRKSANLPQFHS